MKTLLREPLVHFLALGGLLFAIFALAQRRSEPPVTTSRIVVTAAMVDKLASGYQRTSGRLPEAAEKQRLIDDYVREEVLVREARALDLDRDDPVVRGELRRRMELMAEKNAALVGPSDAQRRAAIDAAYQRMRARYNVVIEPPAAPAKSPR